MKCFLLMLTICLGLSCYSFKGISIDPNDKTFYIRTFETTANNAPPNMAIQFTERLRNKIRSETSLVANDENPHIEFSGTIVDYRVDLVAPKPGEIAGLNRLNVTYEVNMVNSQEEKRSWPAKRNFSFYAEFDNQKDLLSVQETLIDDINDQILEDIFNAAFNNW
jgi:Lipopolysaccharide-assembly